jgi:hypothetical protein
LVGPAQKRTFLAQLLAHGWRSRHRRNSLAIRARVAARRRDWHLCKSSGHVALAYRQRKATRKIELNDIFKFTTGAAIAPRSFDALSRMRETISPARRISDNRVGCFRNIRRGTIKPTQTSFTARGEGPERSFG